MPGSMLLSKPPSPLFASDLATGDAGVRPLLHTTVAVLVMGVACFVGWAAISPVQELSHTQGEIVPSGSVRVLDHLEGGIVDEILVKEGERVEAGQALLRLAGTAGLAERDRLATRKRKLALQAERLRAFASDRNADFSIASSVGDAADDTALLAAQVAARDKSRAVLQAQQDDYKAQLAAAQSQMAAVGNALGLVRDKESIRAKLTEQGLNSRLQLLDVQSERINAENEQLRLEGVVSSLQQNIAGADAKLAELDSRLRQEALDKVASVEAEIAEISDKLAAEDDRAARLTVTAPVAGIVQDLGVETVGSVIEPGSMAARIVPISDTLVAEVHIGPQDIGFVRTGQSAEVKIDAYDYARYGRVQGTLIGVSPTTFLDANKQPY